MTEDQLNKLSGMILLAMNQNAQSIAHVLDVCYRGSTNIEHISYTVAILHALASPNQAQHIINLGLPFSPEGFWNIVEELSDNEFGKLFEQYDNRPLRDALITRGQTVTYFKPPQESTHEETN